MSFMNPVDMVEEDAADLQFPKVDLADPADLCEESDYINSNQISPVADNKALLVDAPSESPIKIINLKPLADTDHKTVFYDPLVLAKAAEELAHPSVDYSNYCEICRSDLEEPFIKCAECHVLLCVHCFAKGDETGAHFNSHSYIVIRDDVQVFPVAGDWTAREERVLLAALQTSGYGNWEAVAKALGWQRTPDECRQHYHNCYFGGIFERLLGLTHISETYFPQRTPYLMKMRSVDPPRTDDITSVQFKAMAGYRCARGDFDTPYDISAESFLTAAMDVDLSTWEDEASREVLTELQCALVRAYNRRLKERYRRYRIMRDHGLIMPHRTLAWISKYAEAFGSESNCTRFLSFMQMCEPIEFDKLVESIQYVSDLRKSLLRLYELRENGVRTLGGGVRYFEDKRKRLLEKRERANKPPRYDWKQFVPELQSSESPLPILRKKPGPMEIIGLPDYARLNDAERELCSVARIYPQNYLSYKNILKTENAKVGHLRLADARRLIKIDVNKTRQIYDFLLEQGHINKAI